MGLYPQVASYPWIVSRLILLLTYLYILSLQFLAFDVHMIHGARILMGDTLRGNL